MVAGESFRWPARSLRVGLSRCATIFLGRCLRVLTCSELSPLNRFNQGSMSTKVSVRRMKDVRYPLQSTIPSSAAGWLPAWPDCDAYARTARALRSTSRTQNCFASPYSASRGNDAVSDGRRRSPAFRATQPGSASAFASSFIHGQSGAAGAGYQQSALFVFFVCAWMTAYATAWGATTWGATTWGATTWGGSSAPPGGLGAGGLENPPHVRPRTKLP